MISQERSGLMGEIARLAKLDAVNYAFELGAAAKATGIKKGELDSAVKAQSKQYAKQLFRSVKSFPRPVSGEQLLNYIAGEFGERAVLPNHAADAAALWVVHTYCLDAAKHTPILALQSPGPRCGKTTVISLVSKLANRAIAVSNITPAAVYRLMERDRPTLVVDEADSFLRDNDALRGVLNSGHSRDSAFVIRCHPETLEPEQFSTWGAKCVASIGKLSATLQDRSIVIPMQRSDLEPRRNGPRMRVITSCCLRWSQDNALALRGARPHLPSLNARAADNWRPLIAIADHAGGPWPERARAAAAALSGASDPASHGEVLLADIHEYIEERGVDRVLSGDLVTHLSSLEHRPWPEWRNGRAITTRQLAELLGAFDIHPRPMRTAAGRGRGYSVDQFTEAFRRYAGVPIPVTERVASRGTDRGDDDSY